MSSGALIRAASVRWCGRALAVIALIAVPCSHALAQDEASFMGGVSLGGGGLILKGATTDPALALVRQEGDRGAVAFAFSMYLGVTDRRKALLFDFSLVSLSTGAPVDGDVRIGSRRVTFRSSDDAQSVLVGAGAYQIWITPRLWIRGGLGAAVLDRDLVIADADLTLTLDKGTAVALVAAAGADFWQHGNFASALEFHFTAFALKGLRVYAPTLRVGLTWY